MNELILGDNLEIMKKMDGESVDLIYLDPPFFSNRNYEVIWGDKGEVRSFQDRWSGGIDHYIAWLKERVEEMCRVLKPTGSIFLHCDWHANAYIRVQILDRIFGYENFNSEIIWERTTNSGSSKGVAKKFPNDHDTIFFYTKQNKTFKFNNIFKGYSQSYINHYYIYDDNDGKGKYQLQALKTVSSDRLEQLKAENRIVEGKGKYLRFKDYLNDKKGVPINDMWYDIEPVNPISRERIGYPTQKPESLMERIIRCASNEGDIVFDPFVGGGTTVAVADKLKRRWIGIDQSTMAVKVTELRLERQRDLFSQPYTVTLHKYDYDALRDKDAFDFETWIIQQYGGTPQNKKGGDKGIDGKTADGSPIQVKRSENIGVNVVKNFSVSAKQFNKPLFEKSVSSKKPVGYIIAFTFSKGAIGEVARLKNDEKIIIELVKVEDIVPISKKPRLTVKMASSQRNSKDVWEIDFTAQGESEAGIEFYSWDFAYDESAGFRAEVMIDKAGAQKRTFKAGAHTVAAKVFDNDGLENIEIVKLKVNGAVEAVFEGPDKRAFLV
jgi:site-specific DNA-methyltransferase (adenine-specific)